MLSGAQEKCLGRSNLESGAVEGNPAPETLNEELGVILELEGKPKPPADLPIAMKKQQLFLPVLAPNARMARPSSIETVSGSDEYESADEQPLHGIKFQIKHPIISQQLLL